MVKLVKIGHNFTLMAIMFGFSRSVTIKITFSESSYHYLSNDISFAWFYRRPNFPIVSSNEAIVTS